MTEKQQEHKDKRNALKELSKIAKMRISADCEGMTVNEVLVEHFYTDDENEEFKTLHQWSKDGYKVKKGSKSFLVWGKPRKTEKATDPKTTQNQEEDESEFYPLCYLFSNAQVLKRDA